MDSAEEDDICDMSLGREIMQAVKRNDPMRPQTRNSLNALNHSNNRDSSSASEYSANCQGDDIDDYINEALEDDEDSYQENVTPVNKRQPPIHKHFRKNNLIFCCSVRVRFRRTVFRTPEVRRKMFAIRPLLKMIMKTVLVK